MDSEAADNKNWKAIMAKYGDKKDPIDTFSQAGHLSARVATEALLKIKGTIDRKSVHDAFKGVTKFRTDMMCAPWYFGPGERHQPNHEGRAADLVAGGFKTVTQCYRSKDDELADVLDLEKKGGLVN